MHLHRINVMEMIDDFILENILERQTLLVKLAEEGDEMTVTELSDINAEGQRLFREYKGLLRARAQTTPRMATAFRCGGRPARC